MTALPLSQPPYGPKEAAERLGVSVDLLEKQFAALGGVKLGRRILIPRHTVDALVDGPDAQKPALERVLATLPALSPEDRLTVARAALTA